MTDPLARAGILVCCRCSRVGWPIDATWLPGGLILVEYIGDCGTTDGQVRIVDPAALISDDRCLATTAAGTRCSRRVVGGGYFCTQHDPDRQDRRTP